MLHPRYSILETLGKGGMGIVYKALDRHENRLVALKKLRGCSNEDRERFEHEIRTLGNLRHDGIVRLHDVGHLDGDLFFTMECLDGVTLEDLRRRPPLGKKEIHWLLHVTLKVLDALAHIHSRGVLHGDLKPSNIMVIPAAADASGATSEPSRTTSSVPWEPFAEPSPGVKVLDFGFARPRAALEKLPVNGAGTPLYMAPEQVDGSPVDERSDLYSLGALLYHLVAREPPYSSLAAILSRKSAAAPPRQHNPACPAELSDLLLDLLHREPHRRPATASDVARTVTRWLEPRTGVPREVAPRLLSPVFVGRERELEAIRDTLRTVAPGASRVLRVIGEQGSGKSWLVHRGGLRSEVVLDFGMAFLRAAFGPGGAERQGLYGLLRDALALLATHRKSPAALLEPWALEHLEQLGLTVEGSHSTPEPTGVTASSPLVGGPQIRREQLLQTASKLLRAAAESQPVLLAFEDVHQASDLEIELLRRLERALRELPACLLVTYRPEAVAEDNGLSGWIDEQDGGESTPSITLGGFSDSELASCIEAMLHPRGPAARELLAHVMARSGGRPVAVHRSLQTLWERDAVRQESGVWHLVPEALATADDTDTAQRLQRLAPARRRILGAAVVIDMPANPEMMCHLLADDGDRPVLPMDIAGDLRWLTRSGFLLDTPDGFTPAPHVAGDLESLLSPEETTSFHRRAARYLLAGSTLHSDGQFFRVATHLLRGGETEKAWQYFMEAGNRAAAIFANRRAHDAFRAALEVASGPRERAAAAQRCGEIEERVGRYPSALQSLQDAAGDADEAQKVVLWDKIGTVLQRQGDLDGAEACFERCTRSGRAGTDVHARALFRLGGVFFDRNDLARARDHYQRSLALYGEEGNPEGRMAVFSNLGLVEKQEGNRSAALRCFEHAHQAAREAGNLLIDAAILGNMGNLHRMLGDTRAAVDCLRQSIEARERSGDRQGLAICLNNMSRVHAYRGDFRAALDATARALEIFVEIGDRKGVLIAHCNLADSQLLLARFPAARSTLESSIELARRLDAAGALGTALCLRGQLELQYGDAAKAEESLRECLRGLPGNRFPDMRAQVLGTLVETLLERSRAEEARDALAEAFELTADKAAPETPVELITARVRLHLFRGEDKDACDAGDHYLRNVAADAERHQVARLHRELGKAYLERGPEWADRTEKHLGTALHEFEVMKCPSEGAETLSQWGRYWKLVGEDEVAEDCWQRATALFHELGLPRRICRLEELQERT